MKRFFEKRHLLRACLIERLQMRQRVVFFGALGVIALLMIGGCIYKSCTRNSGKVPKEIRAARVEKKIKIESGGAVLNPQEIWVDRLEKEQALLTKRFANMEKMLSELAHQKLGAPQHAAFPTATSPVLTPSGAEAILSPQQNVLNPRDLQSRTSVQNTNEAVFTKHHPEKTGEPKEVVPTKFQRVTFNVDPLSSKKIKKSIDHYVPAGSFVRGRLTSGVVAPTSVQASSNPQPIHIELTNLGNLPRGFKADVKQCFLIGSAYGDLSSERVLMRLETLSCVERKTEEIIELEVDGFVTGEDGANGLRGILVDRTGPAMRSAFVGGFLSGVGNFFGQQQTSVPAMISPGGVASINPLSTQHMLQGGAGKGVGNAMEKLSDFYIKRAEQLQPVLEVEPGRLVHVVFKKGFDMNQTVYRQSLMNVRDHGRRNLAEQSTTDQQHEPHL